jgi:Mn-dependent DtxR family transcriptional regulator
MAEISMNEKVLLESLLVESKYLHMGKFPVTAIQICFELSDKGYIIIDDNNMVSITDKGREVLKSIQGVVIHAIKP